MTNMNNIELSKIGKTIKNYVILSQLLLKERKLQTRTYAKVAGEEVVIKQKDTQESKKNKRSYSQTCKARNIGRRNN